MDKKFYAWILNRLDGLRARDQGSTKPKVPFSLFFRKEKNVFWHRQTLGSASFSGCTRKEMVNRYQFN